MHTRATTRTLVRRMLGILIAVVRRREPRNSKTLFPASAASVFLQGDTLPRQDGARSDQHRQLQCQSLRLLNPAASLA